MASLILQNIMPCSFNSFWNVVAMLTLSNTTSIATVGIMSLFADLVVSNPSSASRSCNGTPNFSNVSSISCGMSSLSLNLGAE